MEIPPPHILAQLDAIIVGQSRATNDGGGSWETDEGGSPDPEDDETAPYDHSGDPFLDGDETVDLEGDVRTTSSRFWGVSWDRRNKKWRAQYQGADGKTIYIGIFDDDDEAARAVNKAIREAGLEAKRHMNEVDAAGALVPKRAPKPKPKPKSKPKPKQRDRSAVVPPDPARAPTATTSKFWGVSWSTKGRWQARYKDANGKQHTIGYFDTQEEAARAVNKAIRDAGLEGRRKMNAVDATGALVPRVRHTSKPRDRSAVVAPDAARAPSATTSKYWGVSWCKSNRWWVAYYTDANGKLRRIGRFDTQEAAAHAVNAAIRRAGLEGRRKTNPVVDGQLVPRARKASGHGEHSLRKRRREEAAAAAPSTRPRN